MSLLAALRVVEKDLSHAMPWIDDALKVAATISGVVDPPLAPLFQALDAVFENVTNVAKTAGDPVAAGAAVAGAIKASDIQALIQAVTLIHVVKPALLAPAA